jgi:hypothetical protein
MQRAQKARVIITAPKLQIGQPNASTNQTLLTRPTGNCTDTCAQFA